ncbi:hypothetical protein MCOR02_003530 [Pyricularia oryzae]|nr:hypothetical protein MCOR02_003530 [Pyricularia oryzae]
MASPSSPAAMSDNDNEAPSSPGHGDNNKSFAQATEDEDTRMADSTPQPTEKRKGRASGKVDSTHSSSQAGKIRHLKKNDGEPLWREDIQYDFLKAVFDDEHKVFTNSYEKDRLGPQCFADLYIDTMSRSSKTSKVLRDKLLSGREAAKGMAMVCLLVNIGRMNTTLNFFPEMRAQLRTYHSIPSLQAHQDSNTYKQLQDAPRLKSILKGGAEDRAEPNSLDRVKSLDVPRTNPVNLLFVITANAPKIAEMHFPPDQEFQDLVMKPQFTSASRARAFLWMMWFYLESDFTEEGCEENPFGAGVDYGLDVANQGVPKLELIKPGDPPENVDTPEEREFGEEKKRMRAKIIDADKAFVTDTQSKRGARPRVFMPNGPDEILAAGSPAVLPRMRPSRHESDMDSTRSTPPPRATPRQLAGPVGSAAGKRPGAALKYQIFEGASSPAPPEPKEVGGTGRKPRPPTAHQIAVEHNRSARVNHILDRGVRKQHHYARKTRRLDGAIFRAVCRLRAGPDADHPAMPDPVEDSEGEETLIEHQRIAAAGVSHPDPALHCAVIGGKKTPYRARGFGGLCPLVHEEDDFGEEAASYAAAFRRAARRLERWGLSGADDSTVTHVPTIKRKRLVPPPDATANDQDPNETEDDGDATMMAGAEDSIMGDEDESFQIDHNSALTPRAQIRRRRGGARGGSSLANGAAKRRITASPAGANRRSKKPAVNGTGPARQSKLRDTGEDAEELEDVDKLLLGMASGSDGEGDGDVDGDAMDGVEAEGEAEEDGLDDLDKTLLGIGDEGSDSD